MGEHIKYVYNNYTMYIYICKLHSGRSGFFHQTLGAILSMKLQWNGRIYIYILHISSTWTIVAQLHLKSRFPISIGLGKFQPSRFRSKKFHIQRSLPSTWIVSATEKCLQICGNTWKLPGTRLITRDHSSWWIFGTLLSGTGT